MSKTVDRFYRLTKLLKNCTEEEVNITYVDFQEAYSAFIAKKDISRSLVRLISFLKHHDYQVPSELVTCIIHCIKENQINPEIIELCLDLLNLCIIDDDELATVIIDTCLYSRNENIEVSGLNCLLSMCDNDFECTKVILSTSVFDEFERVINDTKNEVLLMGYILLLSYKERYRPIIMESLFSSNPKIQSIAAYVLSKISCSVDERKVIQVFNTATDFELKMNLYQLLNTKQIYEIDDRIIIRDITNFAGQPCSLMYQYIGKLSLSTRILETLLNSEEGMCNENRVHIAALLISCVQDMTDEDSLMHHCLARICEIGCNLNPEQTSFLIRSLVSLTDSDICCESIQNSGLLEALELQAEQEKNEDFQILVDAFICKIRKMS